MFASMKFACSYCSEHAAGLKSWRFRKIQETGIVVSSAAGRRQHDSSMGISRSSRKMAREVWAFFLPQPLSAAPSSSSSDPSGETPSDDES